MSFREKSAWILLISISLVSIVFFLHLPWTLTPPPMPFLVRGLIYCLITLVVIEVVAHVILAVRNPQEARTPRDERERLIDLKATRIAYWIYVVASLAVLSTTHHGANGIFLSYAVLLAFAVGEIVRHAVRIFYHRRGF